MRKSNFVLPIILIFGTLLVGVWTFGYLQSQTTNADSTGQSDITKTYNVGERLDMDGQFFFHGFINTNGGCFLVIGHRESTGWAGGMSNIFVYMGLGWGSGKGKEIQICEQTFKINDYGDYWITLQKL